MRKERKVHSFIFILGEFLRKERITGGKKHNMPYMAQTFYSSYSHNKIKMYPFVSFYIFFFFILSFGTVFFQFLFPLCDGDFTNALVHLAARPGLAPNSTHKFGNPLLNMSPNFIGTPTHQIQQAPSGEPKLKIAWSIIVDTIPRRWCQKSGLALIPSDPLLA